MLFFINSEGRVVGQTPGGLTQGSSKANVLQVVAPFPTAVLTVSFQLPNRIVLGPYVEDGSAPADEYTMTRAFEIEGFNVGGTPLTVYTYTCSRELTALSGELGIQFFITVGEGTRDPENVTEFVPTVDDIGGYTIAVPMVNVPVYSGTRFIPSTTIGANDISTIEQILELVSLIKIAAQDASDAAQDAEAALGNAVLKNPPGAGAQSINGSLSILDLQVRDVSASSMSVDRDMSVGGNTHTDSLTVVEDASIGGNLEVAGDITGNNISEITRKLADAVLKNPQGGGTQDIKSALKALQIYTVGYANFGSNVDVQNNLTVKENLYAKNLYVKDTMYTVEQQTLIVKDNIIVTNAIDGATSTASGLVINKGNGEAYAILYMPEGDAGDAVYIGEGTLTFTQNSTTGVITDVSFTYNGGQALPLAARSGSFTDGEIPMWDAEKNAFVSSGKNIGNIVEDALGDIDTALNSILAIQNNLIGGAT